MIKDIDLYIEEKEKELVEIYKNIDKIESIKSKSVLDAFHDVNVSQNSFLTTTGYGYDDLGRNQIEKIFAKVLHASSALVRTQFISGSHALTVCFFALLRPGDTLLSISGKPYDTLDEVIGIKPNNSSLLSFNINYEQIDLLNNDFNYEKIKEAIENNKKIKVIEIQRSRGYSTRSSLSFEKVDKVAKYIKSINKDIIIMVDNCYTEFVEEKEILESCVDIAVGSLIKNLGGGIATNGAYIAGKDSLVNLCAERLNLPGEGKDVGPTLGTNKEILLGLFLAPSVVASALKTAVLTSRVMEDLNYHTSPRYMDNRVDIVQTITFNDKEKLLDFVGVIQSSSAIDSSFTPVESDMPGYGDKIIMASGSFTQGSSIELSCDGPIKKPYIAFMQGSLTYQYGKIAVKNILKKFYNN